MAEMAAEQERRIRLRQRRGEFRELDPKVLALNGALNEVIARAATDPDFDTQSCARELAELFDQATHGSSARSGSGYSARC